MQTKQIPLDLQAVNAEERAESPIENQTANIPTKMNHKPKLKKTRQVGGLAAAAFGLAGTLLFAPPELAAQEEEDDDIFELSPFTVEAEEDEGYRATSTLAGSRLDTDLKNLGSAISVVTEQFLEDTNSRNINELLVYTTGTEAGGPSGNFLGLAPDDSSGTVGEVFTPQQNFTRVRGLAAADLTRDFFLTDIPLDSYNTNRVDIQRGANNILFGLGSPAGIINNGLNKARLNEDSAELELQYGSFNSNRATLDLNQVVIPGQLAVRINSLFAENKFDQRDTFARDKRLYGAMTWTPKHKIYDSSEFLDRTTVRGSFEWGETTSNRPRTTPPGDSLSSFFDPAKLNKQGFDPATTGFNDLVGTPFGFAANPGRWWFHTGIIFPDESSQQVGVQNTDIDALWSRPESSPPVNGVVMPAYLGSQDNTLVLGRLPDDLKLELFGGDVGGERVDLSAFWKRQDILDSSVFNFFDQQLEGDNKRIFENFNTFNIAVEQTFWNKRFGFEFSYDHQDYDVNSNGFNSITRADEINIDVNKTLHDGSPNPNFGRPFFTGRHVGNIRENLTERRVLRGTAFARFDFNDMLPGQVIAPWLGEHTFTYLHQRQDIDASARAYDEFSADQRLADLRNGTTNRRNARLQITTVNFLGPSLLDLDTPEGADIPALDAPRQPSSGFSALVLNPETNQFETLDNFQILRNVLRDASKNKEDINSDAIIWQGNFLDGMVSGLFGWREDRFEFFEVQGRDLDGDNMDDLPDPQFVFSGVPNVKTEMQTRSWGVVGHLPDIVRNNLPLGIDLDIHYNESENAAPGGIRRDFRGNQISSPVGETEDYGFTISFLENKLVAKVNWFESSQNFSTSSNQISGFFIAGGFASNIMTAINTGLNEGNIEGVNAFLTQGGKKPENALPLDYPLDGSQNVPVQNLREALPFNLWETGRFTVDESGVVTAEGVQNLTQIEDFVSEGVEIELFAQPIKNWNITVNAAKQDSVRDNNGKLLAPLVEEWYRIFQQTGNLTSNDIEPANQRFRRDLLNPWLTLQALNGSIAPELREWRINFVNNYKFTSDSFGPAWLDGVGIGNAIRWQDNIGIGFPITRDPDTGQLREDIDNPFMGPSETKYDFWLSYESQIGDLGWKAQLNVKNAFTKDETVPVLAQPDGSLASVRIDDPRRFTFSLTFSY